MNEIWKDIKDYEGYYQVSNLGNVRSCNRTIIENGTGKTVKHKSRKLKAAKNHDGYLQIVLSKESICVTNFVHRLVAKAFIPNPLNKPTVNHIDGNKQNNNVLNLEWSTKSEQAIHSLNKKLRTMPNVWNNKFGSKHCASKKVLQYSKTGSLIKEHGSIVEAAKEVNISPSSITHVCKGRGKSAGGYCWKFETVE